MSFSFEKDWFKKLAKILKRRARDKQKKKKDLSAKFGKVSTEVTFIVLNC